ncbi:helix-turn-helix domain-containing protein [Anoxybacteroides tepidamans]|uniref:helix-turn-helix domain-containing protein n=1 Tax=Anoxybacteroides tepidamans TaxID=265948 RepID=UPI000489F646|nr:response regulator transcription factor [Anoxybacillus tepidamans]
MSQALNHHLHGLLNSAIQLLSVYKEELLQERNRILDSLRHANKRSEAIFAFISDFLLECLATARRGNVEAGSMLWNMQQQWVERFSQRPDPEAIIFSLNLLENASHKILKSRIAFSSKLHPSVHYLFSKIGERILYSFDQELVGIDAICEQILEAPGIRVKWIARIEEKKEGFYIKKIIGPHPNAASLNGENFFATWNEVANVLSSSRLPIPWKNELLLFGTTTHHHIDLDVVFHILRKFQLEEERQLCCLQENLWKDAVILFNEWIIRSQNFQEAIENICFGFGHFLPFERCALFKFSNMESIGVGLYGYHLNKEEIQAIAEKMDNIPILNESLVKLKSQNHEMKNFQPIYVPFAHKEFPKKYVETFQLASLMIVPIYVPTEGKIIGGVVLDKGPGQYFTVDRTLFPALMKFGQSSGELLLRFIEANIQPTDLLPNNISLSSREIEIIKLLADGASTSEAAVQLYLSEFTVRDYISNIMKKLNARNRTEVAVKAIRLGIIQ